MFGAPFHNGFFGATTAVAASPAAAIASVIAADKDDLIADVHDAEERDFIPVEGCGPLRSADPDPDGELIPPPDGYHRSQCYLVRRPDRTRIWIPY